MPYLKTCLIHRNQIGLDPASVGFPLESLDTRLDTTDALFVDVIHTNLAFINATGHADFYPNGGVRQPGCPVPDNGFNKIKHIYLLLLLN